MSLVNFRWQKHSLCLRSILRALDRPTPPAQRITGLFSSSQNTLRDALSEEGPTASRRHGQVDACLTDTFQSLSCDQTSSQYFPFILSCGSPSCAVRVKTTGNVPRMLTPDVWVNHSGNPPHHESLQERITTYFDHEASSLSPPCPKCRGDYTQTRSFLQPPWLGFEVFVEQTDVVLPSFELKFSSCTCRLAAIAYGDGCHSVAHPSTPSGAWWYYDDRVNGGQPAEVRPNLGHKQQAQRVPRVSCKISRRSWAQHRVGCSMAQGAVKRTLYGVPTAEEGHVSAMMISRGVLSF